MGREGLAWDGRVLLGSGVLLRSGGFALRFLNSSTKSVYGSAEGYVRFYGSVTTLPRAFADLLACCVGGSGGLLGSGGSAWVGKVLLCGSVTALPRASVDLLRGV